jgi:hypothetical protein
LAAWCELFYPAIYCLLQSRQVFLFCFVFSLLLCALALAFLSCYLLSLAKAQSFLFFFLLFILAPWREIIALILDKSTSIYFFHRIIEETRRGVAGTVNAGLTILNWRVGKRINKEIFKAGGQSTVN